jgi:3-deoxy-D-manno-octulosonate 8-phosphate phosphatase (KDO 8-P phosphatase)
MTKKKLTRAALKKKAQRIKLVVLDVDGVLSEGSMVYTEQGNSIKIFNVKDGLGVALLIKAGIPAVILSAMPSPIVRARAKDLHIKDVYFGLPKIEIFPRILKKYKFSADEVCFIGDDVIDIDVVSEVGFSVAVADAVNELKKAADYVTPQKGGRGAVRHIIELIMKSQGLWQF